MLKVPAVMEGRAQVKVVPIILGKTLPTVVEPVLQVRSQSPQGSQRPPRPPVDAQTRARNLRLAQSFARAAMTLEEAAIDAQKMVDDLRRQGVLLEPAPKKMR